MTHARLAPSAASQWIACPASIKLAESLNLKEEESPYAREGSAAHELAAMCLDTGADPGASIGKVMGEFKDFPVTQEMVDAVKVYVDFVRLGLRRGVLHEIEQRCDLSWIHPDIFGTPDDYIYDPKTKRLCVYDYKHGMGVSVDATRNPQCMLYALGALQKVWGHRRTFYPAEDAQVSMKDLVHEVVVYIVQPRVKGESAVREWRTNPEDLLFWGLHVARTAALLVDSDDAPFALGKHCRFCDAAAVCPEKVAAARRLFADGATPSLDPMTPEELEEVLLLAENLSSFHGQILGFMKTQMEGGAAYPNHKLIRKWGNRAWKNEDAAETAFFPVLGNVAFAKRKILSVAQMEKALKAKEVFTPAAFNAHVEKPDKGLVVAPMDHKSPAENSPVAMAMMDSMDILQP